MVDYGPLSAEGVTSQEQADAAVRAHCGWHIAPTITETVTIDGSGTNLLVLPTLYVVDVVSLTELNLALIGDVDYQWRAAGLLTRSWPALWTDRPRAVVVELTHGYESVPADLDGVAADFARAIDINLAGGAVTAGPFSISGYSDGLDGQFAAGSYALRVLDKYRIPNLT